MFSHSDSFASSPSESPFNRPAPWLTLFFTLGIVWDRFWPISYTSRELLFMTVGLTLVWLGCLLGYLRGVLRKKLPLGVPPSGDLIRADSSGASHGRVSFLPVFFGWLGKIRIGEGHTWWGVAMMWTTLVAIGYFGAIYHHHAFYRFSECDIGRLLPESEPVSVEGIVVRSPRYFSVQTTFGKNKDTENSEFILAATSAGSADGDVRVDGNVQVFVFGRIAALRSGDRVRVVGMRQGPYPTLAFGDYDAMESAQAKRTLVSLQVSQPSGVQILSTGGDRTWRGRIDAVRNAGMRILRFHLDAQTYPVAEAILLGYCDDLSDDTRDAFLQTGTIHLLSISGLHVGIFAAMLFAIGRFVRLPQSLAWLVTMLGVGGYIILTGAEPPAVRAGLFLLCFCLSQHPLFYGRRLEIWSIAFVVILLHDPNHLFRIGFLYSFLCVGTIFWIIKRQMEYETTSEKLLRIEYERDLSPMRRLGRRFVRELTQLLLISGLLWFVSAGLTLAQFGQTSPCSILSNLPAIFTTTVFLWLSFAILLFGWLGTPSWLISCLVACDETVLRFLMDFLQWIATLPGAFVQLPPPPQSWTVCFYVVLFLLVAFPKLLQPLHLRRCPKEGEKKSSLARPDELGAGSVSSSYSSESCVCYLCRPFSHLSYGVLLLLGCCGCGAVLVLTPTSSRGLEVQMLAVGHGNATLVRTPAGRVILYDGGSLGNTERTAQRILRAMWVWRERRIDTVVISHLDADHYNAIPTLCQNIAIGEVCYGPLPLPILQNSENSVNEQNENDVKNGEEASDSTDGVDSRTTGLASIKDMDTLNKLRNLRRVLEEHEIPIRLVTEDIEWWKEPGLTMDLWVFTEDAIRSMDRLESSMIPELTSSNANGIACYIRYDNAYTNNTNVAISLNYENNISCSNITNFQSSANLPKNDGSDNKAGVICEDSTRIQNKTNGEYTANRVARMSGYGQGRKAAGTVRTLLLTGDLDGEAVTTLTDREPCGVEILAAPHHGSVKSCSDALLAWTNPETVIISSTHSDYRLGTEDFYRSTAEQTWFTWREGSLYGLGTMAGWQWTGWRCGEMD